VKLKKAPLDLFPCATPSTRFRVAGSNYVTADGVLALHLTPTTLQSEPLSTKTEASGWRGHYTVTHVGSGSALRSKIPGQKLARAYLAALVTNADGIDWATFNAGRKTEPGLLKLLKVLDDAAWLEANKVAEPEAPAQEVAA